MIESIWCRMCRSNCSESDNKMDVFFMNKEIMNNMMDSESSDKLLSSINNRDIIFCQRYRSQQCFLNLLIKIYTQKIYT